MTGPLYASRNHEVVFQPPQSALLQQNTEIKVERYPSSVDGMANIHWPSDDYGEKMNICLNLGNWECVMTLTALHAHAQLIVMLKGVKHSRTSEIFDAKFHRMFYGDAKGWAKRMCLFLLPYIPGVINPHALFVQRWNKDNKCIVLNWPLTTTMVVLRCMTDFIYLLHILLQFRLVDVAPESRVMGAGDLVDAPKRIARNYLYGYCIIDVFVIIILLILPHSLGSSGANYAKKLLRTGILVQYIPRLFRFLPLLAGRLATGLIFESAWANFVINLLTYVLASHVVDSLWYLLDLDMV